MRYLRALSAVLWKDLAAELRGREMLSAMLVFALLVIFIFNFALELDSKTRAAVTAGVLWVTFAFAGTLGLNRSMAMEKDRGCLDGLLLTPVDRSSIYYYPYPVLSVPSFSALIGAATVGLAVPVWFLQRALFPAGSSPTGSGTAVERTVGSYD